MKYQLPSENDWLWLQELAIKIGLIKESGRIGSKSKKTILKLAIDDLDLISILSIVSRQVITRTEHPWTLEYIMVKFFGDESKSSREIDTLRRYLHEKLSVLSSFGFLEIIRAKDFYEGYKVIPIEHGRTNLFFITGKGLVACQILSLFPYLYNKHFDQIQASTKNLCVSQQSFAEYFIQLDYQAKINYFIKQEHEKHQSELFSINGLIFDQMRDILEKDRIRFAELISPLSYYLSEFNSFYLMRVNFNSACNTSVSIGFSVKYISFVLNFFESEIKKCGYKNPKDKSFSLFF